MSRKANLWAIEQRGLKPTTKIVLWHLCDRFNPTMAASLRKPGWLMTARSADPTLNDHLDRLEAARLLRRVPRMIPSPSAKCRHATFGFEDARALHDPEHDPEPCPESGHWDWFRRWRFRTGTADDADPSMEIGHENPQKAVFGFCAEPCPENADIPTADS